MQGAKSLLDRLNKLKSAIETDVPNAIGKEVENRRQNAEYGFQSADYDGVNDVTVTSTHVQNGTDHQWDIKAEGKKVLFIEYGTGILLRHDSQFGNESGAPSVYTPRSWSLGPQGKQWLSDENVKKHYGGWPYDGKWTYGNPSANVMYDTSKVLRSVASTGKLTKSIHEALK